MSAIIAVNGLVKRFRQGFFMRQVEAVRGISFDVQAGEIFGFLGPNGAGKTTTIKMLTGLIRPTAGDALLFGLPVWRPATRKRLGFLPENPYVYPFLTPIEFVEMCGRLSGLKGKVLRDASLRVLERVGILYAKDRPVRRLSKGMLQRTGLAAALVSDPELLILDEPMSGLDPVGRREVRDVILEERRRGRTIFFSTHILSDVETLCDRVTILRRGVVAVSGRLADLLVGDAQVTDLQLRTTDATFETICKERGYGTHRVGDRLMVQVPSKAALKETLARAVQQGVLVERVNPQSETLEDLFVKEAFDGIVPPSPASRLAMQETDRNS